MRLLLLILLVVYEIEGKVHFVEEFNDNPFTKGRWVKSTAIDNLGEFAITPGMFHRDPDVDSGLRTMNEMRLYLAGVVFPSFSTRDTKLVVQYQVKHENRSNCSGAYIKLGPRVTDVASVRETTPFNIMFGPDVCGPKAITHLILNSSEITPPVPNPPVDGTSHLYRFVLNPDDTFMISIDDVEVTSGPLEERFALNAPKLINDPNVVKPSDWVEEMMIPDPNATKPSDWVDIDMIDDGGSKPLEWDDDEDGEWTPNMIPNPIYRGPWSPPLVDNPKYVGPWIHPQIPNPDYVRREGFHAFDDISMLTIDLWQVEAGVLFDNIIICTTTEEADELANRTWKPLVEVEKQQKKLHDANETLKMRAASQAEEQKNKNNINNNNDGGSNKDSHEVDLDFMPDDDGDFIFEDDSDGEL
eukprot:GHVR01175670.1.p1 GENE.GHVR01175670.1~~GHVR01175670.1.p1  ORF type:complete len:414 (+),score=118.53 GHVR01175670.1:72-1313(+)